MAQAKLLRDFCREALVWRQLRHPNILPFLGVSEDLFAPSYCLISPWMVNGNIMSDLEAHPDHDRLTSLIQIAEGMKYLHNLDPPIVHSDIRGANILVMDDLCCCLADFGLSLSAESRALDSTSRMSGGTIRWLAPEYMDSTLFDQSYLTARDIYAYGCTIVEIFTGKPPFSEIKSEVGVMHEVLTKQICPRRPPLNIFSSERLWSLVMTCLKTLSDRRPNVEGILEFLMRFLTSSEPDLKILYSYPSMSPYSPVDAGDLEDPSPLLTAPEDVDGSTATTPSIIPEYPNRAQALYSYEASPADPNDLSFTVDEILYVNRTSQDWWEARKKDGSIGTVPSNFLRLLPL